MMISIGLIVLFGQIAYSANPNDIKKSLRPLENILRNDGSLDLNGSDSNGSYDTKGWVLLTGSDGKPRFVRKNRVTSFSNRPVAIAGDEDWNDKGYHHWINYTGVCGTFYLYYHR